MNKDRFFFMRFVLNGMCIKDMNIKYQNINLSDPPNNLTFPQLPLRKFISIIFGLVRNKVNYF